MTMHDIKNVSPCRPSALIIELVVGVPTLPPTIGPTWTDFGRRERQRDRDVGEFAQRPCTTFSISTGGG